MESTRKRSPTLKKEKLANTETGQKELRSSIKNRTQPLKKKKIKLLPLRSEKQEERVIKLESPTSISLKNSFLIKNADPSFEKCYA